MSNVGTAQRPMCGHPALVPTQWNQAKPEPAEMVGPCPHNKSCPTCGWGWGSSPCPCSRNPDSGEQKMSDPCCFIHSRRTAYCAEWDFVNDTTQEYARLDFLGLAPCSADRTSGKP